MAGSAGAPAHGTAAQSCAAARRTAPKFIRIVAMQMAASTALIGRVKNGVRSPSDSTRPRRRFLSRRSPSTMPSTNGAIG